jgi:hypothetical protein
MVKRRLKLATPLVDGLILSSCFFAPLIAGLDAQVFFLHWTPQATVEAVGAFLLIAACGTGLLAFVAHATPRRRIAVVLLAGAIPLASLVFTLLRRFPVKDQLIESAADPLVRAGVIAAAVVAFAAALVRPDWTLVGLRAARLTLMPVLVVTLATLTRALAIGMGTPASAGGSFAPRGIGKPSDHVLVLVLDELSFDRVYRGRDVASGLPHLARFGRAARHHFAATAPGGQTLESMAGLLAVRRFHDVDVRDTMLQEVLADGRRHPLRLDGDGNLFARARAAGFRTELFGTYLPYCDLLRTVLDRCAAYSIYNTSTLGGSFSPLHAIRTSLILLPRQFPTGFLKYRPFAAHQRGLAERLEGHASEPLRTRPTFRFVHFSLPHSPFVFTAAGYDPPANPLAELEDQYHQQLVYVDGLIGRILARLDASGDAARTTIVITSDHEWRTHTPRDRWSHVPLLVRRPSQQSREDEDRPVAAEDLIAGLVTAGS